MARTRKADGGRSFGDVLVGAAVAVVVARTARRAGAVPVDGAARPLAAGDPGCAVPFTAPPPAGPPNVIGRVQDRVDRVQRRFGPVAFLYAVVKKFGDDRAGRLAALIAYYGFFSIFPLLLALVTVLKLALNSHATLRDHILSSALTQVPGIGGELGDTGVTGNWWALVVGLLGALWAGMGALLATQDAFNTVWDVPLTERPNFLVSRVRGLLLLAVVGTGLLATTIAQSLIAGLVDARAARLLLPLAVLVLDMVVMALVFRVLTDLELGRRELLPAALVAGTGYWVVQLAGNWYFQRAVNGASETYGTFAVVIGLLSWFYLLAQVVLLGAEVAVVWSRGLWPRSLSPRHPTQADQDVYEAIARSQVKPVVVAEGAAARA